METDINGLPATYRDAIEVTRKLDVQFLWIDSFCVIQDDPHDWETESWRMQTIFSLAYCTIAAGSTTDRNDGFLKPRAATAAEREVKIPRLSHGPLYVCDAIDDFDFHVECSELSTRGWVLQERALSRRMIHFTASLAAIGSLVSSGNDLRMRR
ncbi:heterokaryon incompatibility protein-domain-containing protein [Bisporella sp. PMI_857]|nr:heterokaryon incompatibility protein-domain-containing protein [Bisporella sp. PMI_857]